MGKKILLEHLSEVDTLCRLNGVKALFAFGSVLSEKFNDSSDIDFVVELKPNNNPVQIGESMISLWNGLEKTFDRPVDLLRMEAIKNPILKEEIERTKVAVYEA